MNDDHVHNQLCARIEELEAEKMELNERLDIVHQERDALAAHVERLQCAIRAAINTDWSVPAEEALEEALDGKAATSLARLKAEWQTEALVEALEQVIKAAPSGGPLWHGSEQIVEARAALAAHRKQGGAGK